MLNYAVAATEDRIWWDHGARRQKTARHCRRDSTLFARRIV